jgi:hypothetical protein
MHWSSWKRKRHRWVGMPERSPSQPSEFKAIDSKPIDSKPIESHSIQPADVWLRRLLGWVYIAIGAAIWASVISNIGPFAPAYDSPESRRLEWAPITFPIMLFVGAVFAFAGYWAMTHPRAHRPATIVLVLLAMTAAFVAYSEV